MKTTLRAVVLSCVAALCIGASLNLNPYTLSVGKREWDANTCNFPRPYDIGDIDPDTQVFVDGGNSQQMFNDAAGTFAYIKQQVEAKPDFYKRLMFITHGYMQESSTPWMHDMKDKALAANNDQIVVLVGWEKGAAATFFPNTAYSQPASNVVPTGNFIGSMAKMAKDDSATSSLIIYGVGHSLGCHVMANAGKSSGVFDRITGLDPAMPCFEAYNEDKRLKPSDATFVDAIHSGAADPNRFAMMVLGTNMRRGDIDFYPNWGQAPQPGCTIPNGICSHIRAIDVYNWSIDHKGMFATKASITGQFTPEDIVPKETEDVDPGAEAGYWCQEEGLAHEGAFYLEVPAEQIPFQYSP